MNYRYNEEKSKKDCACCCTGILYGTITALVSVLFATAIGLLFGFGLLTNASTLVWVALGIALGILVLTIVGSITSGTDKCESQLSKCLCRYLGGLLFGTIGTIIFALAALAISLAAISIAAIIIVVLLALAFAVLITTLVFLIRCIVCKSC